MFNFHNKSYFLNSMNSGFMPWNLALPLQIPGFDLDLIDQNGSSSLHFQVGRVPGHLCPSVGKKVYQSWSLESNHIPPLPLCTVTVINT